ncbi:MAG: MerR family transcriptional regulator [Chitinophagaceae bacterium]
MGKPLNQPTFEFSEESVSGEKQLLSRKLAEPVQEKPKSNRGRKSIKETEVDHENFDIPEDEALFSKQYYSIGEVANMFRVNTSLLRYWENEFDILQPRKNRKGDRFFKPSDIKNLQLIYDLLRRRKFTIDGARDYLKKNLRADEKYAIIQSLQRLRSFLLELKAHL